MTNRRTIAAVCFFLLAGAALAASGYSYRLFDGMLPGAEPSVFAPRVFLTDKSHIGYQSFDPGGEELYYAVSDRNWTTSQIYMRTAMRPFEARTVELLRAQWEGEPLVSHDGKRLFFTAVLPPKAGKPWQSDIYFAKRSVDGWTMPRPLPSPVNSQASEWHLSVTERGVLYFCSERSGSRLKGDIYRAVPGIVRFRVEKLPAGINTADNDCDPLIAPDESWLIFHSDRPGGSGAHDLYVSFRDAQGNWSPAVNLGDAINTPAWEMAPSLTPDGKFLMFARRKAFVTDEPSRIWWVSMQAVEALRPKK